MSNDTKQTDLCLEVAEDLAAVLDGTASARLFDHIADCDACRDLRHDAASAAEHVARAGADFRAPTGFADRLIARAFEARPPSAEPALPVVSAAPTPASETSARIGDTAPTGTSLRAIETAATTLDPLGTIEPLPIASEPVGPTAGEELATPAKEHVSEHPAPKSAAPRSRDAVSADTSPTALPRSQDRAIGRAIESGKPIALPAARKVSLLRRPVFYLGLVAAVSTAAAAGFVLKGRAMTPTAATDGAWSGKVTEIARASADKTGGLEACDSAGACVAVVSGGEIHPGTKLRTDARTRAHVALGDGTELALDRGTTVELAVGATRVAKLVEGAIVADVAHLEKGVAAHVTFPHGDVEVLGTKLAVTAIADRATVEVARGEVKIQTDAGKAVSVRAGEEATLADGREPEVASATSLADMLEWSDKTPEEVDAPVLRGLGELRARKPGQTAEKDHAVRLAKHAVKVRVVDVVARTEVDETFTNDTDEELEGIFRFPLPPGAQIEKLSLEVDGKLVDGAFVDRDRGAAIWRGVIQNAAPKTPRPREEIFWVPGPWRDPALLEWQRGGRFELKIFPIPKRGSRRVVLTYTQIVDQAAGVRRFTYPLALDTRASSTVDSFDIDLQVLGGDKAFGIQTRGYDLASAAADGGGERRVMHADKFVPAGDLTVEYALPDRDREVTAWAYQASAPPTAPAAPPNSTKAKTADEKAAIDAATAIENDGSPYVAIAVRPKLPRWQEGKDRLHVIVVDSSRSMVGERFARATHLASSIVREMDRRDSFMLLACDVVCRPMTDSTGRGTPGAPGAAAAGNVESFLSTIEPDGGSDLAASIAAARAAAGSLNGRELRVIYLGDGTPTVGPTRPSHLELAVRTALPDRDGAVVAVALGADADTTSLGALARGGGGIVIPYVPGQRVSSAAIDVLGAAYGLALREPEIELPAGLSQVTPARLDPIRAGGEAFVVARMTGGSDVSGSLKLRGRVGSEKFEQSYPIKILASSNAGNAFVPRLYAAAKIAELETLGGQSEKPMVVELSRRFSVASRFTSLLVLESEAMYTAFGVDRTAAAPLFTGQDQAQSTSADGDTKVDDDGDPSVAGEDQHKSGGGSLSLRSRDDSASAGATAAAPGHAGGFRAPATAAAPADEAERRESRADAFKPDAPAPSAAPPPPPVAKAIAGDPLSEADKDMPAQPHRSAPMQGGPMGRPMTPPWGGRRMVAMHKVFDRKASFDVANTLAQQNASKLVIAESAIQSTPDSRDRTAELFALYATSGRIGEAQALTARWGSRDALDPDALLARADLAARQGDRDRAIRILGGLADVRPGDRAPQIRLADLEDAAGNAALACEHRISLADMAPSEAKLVSDAVRCARTQGMVDLASLIASDAGATIRDQIEKLVATPQTVAALRGDVQVSADWSGAEDIDVALIDAQGRRISWLGAPVKTIGVSARDVTSTHTETLALSNLPSGSYIVEITRASGGDTGNTVRGDVTLKLAGDTRKIPFSLSGARAEIGTVRVFFTSRLVPVSGGGWGGPVF